MKKYFKDIIWGLALTVFSIPALVLGQTGGPGGQVTGGPGVSNTSNKLQNPLGEGVTLYGFIEKALNAMMKLGFVIAVCFIIYSGFLFVKAQGKPEEIEEAKKTFFYTIIGTAILLGSWIIAQVIKTTVENVTGQSLN